MHKNCGNPPKIVNGYISNNFSTYYASIIHYRCYQNSSFSSSENISSKSICLSNGKWSQNLKICYLNCYIKKYPNTYLNFNPIENFLKHLQYYKINCMAGYQLIGQNNIVCKDGLLSKNFTCVPKTCKKNPPTVKNGIVRFYSRQHNTKGKYECLNGYQLIGQKYTTCFDGRWIYKFNECILTNIS
ncbi:hypothetical protein A3Q56_03972 [Intoshia linei]|uniref:Sushi domain-containing protein n=1 Tax=Intoshia linei TaxID=1819745 RepID=A0A177B1Y6_9BILA|nr:hypothetical protein A3Q56_03972 [Intoshia linei]